MEGHHYVMLGLVLFGGYVLGAMYPQFARRLGFGG